MASPTLLIAAALATTALSTAAGAQSVYFHSPGEQALTADLATRLAAARTAHLAALDRYDADLNAAMAQEEQAIVRQELAQRDTVLMRQLDGDTATLTATVGVRLQSLTDDAAPMAAAVPLDAADEARLQADIGRIQRLRDERDRRVAAVRRAEAGARLARRQFVPCNTDTMQPADPANRELAASCAVAQRTSRRLVETVGCDTVEPLRTIHAIAAGTDRCWNRATGGTEARLFKGEIGEAIAAYDAARIALVLQSDAASTVRDELNALQTYIDCQNRRADAPDASRQIAAAFAQLDGFLTDVATLTESADTTGSATPARGTLATCPVANGTIEVPAVGEVLDTLRKILGGLQVAAQTRGIRAAAAQAAERFRASRLGEIVQAAADPSAARTGKAPAIVAALVRSAAPVEKLAQVRAGTIPDTSGALVALAEARLRATNAAIEVDRLQRAASLARLRVDALSGETLLLRQASGAGTSDRAVVLYAASVERGRIPAHVLSARIDNLEFDAWARRERAAVEAGYAALTPAAVELKTYGEGGIRAETIARFLNVAGLAAIAGTN